MKAMTPLPTFRPTRGPGGGSSLQSSEKGGNEKRLRSAHPVAIVVSMKATHMMLNHGRAGRECEP